eukprot:2409791-Amphidinium_carterae.2
MHFNKGSSMTITINQEAISTRPNYKTIDIKDSKVTTTAKPAAIAELSAPAAAASTAAAQQTSD